MENKPFVLIVDDEWRLAQNLTRFMQRRGFEAKAVTSVTAANAVITERRLDLALVDLKLPDFSGIELCRMMHARYPDTPVLVMSARVNDADADALAEVGIHAYLTKPFALQELTAVLDTLDPLGRSSQRGGARPPAPARTEVHPRLSRVPRQGPRIVLYSHDTMGLGHMRRNILIARSLAESRLKANVLLVSGAREIGRFELPSGIDCLVLPSYRKSEAGSYESRHLDIQTQELVSLRAHTINASLMAFDPDVFVVDNVPRGALNELDTVLSSLHARGRTHLVLGLRDILDEPSVTRKEWEARKNLSAIEWHYDQIWIYGEQRVYDLCRVYDFGDDFTRKARFAGYLDARKRATPRSSELSAPEASDELPNGSHYNLCLVGGGQDGFSLAEAFCLAAQPEETIGLIITGPFMQPNEIDRLNEIAATRKDLTLLGFVQEPTRLLQNARCVVAMGGYNTVNEVLAFRRPTLIVPRIRPRQEQIVRAQRLTDLGYVDMLHPDELSPDAISHWLARSTQESHATAQPIDLSGLDRLVEYVDILMNASGDQHATA